MNIYDCKGGPGTTEPACGACVSCLHRVIEEKDELIKRLIEAGDAMCDLFVVKSGTALKWERAKESK